MTYKYNPFWQQRIRETVRHALNVHPRLTALRVDLRFPDVPAATDAAVQIQNGRRQVELNG